ncbi:peptidoglycan recognition protein family protein [Burkholderia ubonensis]|uniref:peptidoglycan recognition protein family protein n=1 Tax=Burkholderia ubonensis TaxID=101571 RepID=UPI002115F07E|nr:N-acetylmuramoyl-L-alanine amidase [Burkholderia ubonensis]
MIVLFISKNGHVDAERITVKIFPAIERGAMDVVNGIVVHQTDSFTKDSVFGSYSEKGANGAHFLIDKNGEIYQTASLLKKTNHVGRMQSRCIVTSKCTPVELKTAIGMSKSPVALTRHEMKKHFLIGFRLMVIPLELSWSERRLARKSKRCTRPLRINRMHR